MEIDRPYPEKAMKQYYERGLVLEPSRKEVKRKAERYSGESFGKRHTKSWKI